jgi:UDP-N-acetylglucosamine--N-acetylmuramyl-(pentapeptide) pyrophosphoryl-undecaprenol N-acetylglucosamine transferase
MRIAVACGGTGGHIFPGLATARQLRARGHEVSLWMAGKDVESQAVQGWDGPVVTVPAEGMPRRLSPAIFRAALRMLKARRACQQLMRQHAPDGVLAMGSYASVGPVLAARRLRIPYVLHESNVVPGRAISMLARRADAVAISFDATRFHLRRVEVRETGMPLRADLVEAARRPLPARKGEPFTVLFMGGSRGAHAINQIGGEAACRAVGKGVRLRVIHIAGMQDTEAVRTRYREAGVDACVESFVHDMAAVYREADLVVCRSGAASCAELCAFGRPALLVPLPTAIRDHQTANARALERAGAAQVVAERDLRVAWLADYLADGVAHPERLEPMGAAARAIGKLDAAEALADLVESTVERCRAHRR